MSHNTKTSVNPQGPPFTWVSTVSDVFLHRLPYMMLPVSCLPSLLPRLHDSCRCRFLAATVIYLNMALIWVSTAVYLHHVTRRLTPILYPVSCVHTSKIDRVANHSTIVAFLLLMYVINGCVPTACITMSSPYLRQDPSCWHLSLFSITCFKNPLWIPSSLFYIKYMRTHVSTPNSSTAYTTMW